MSEYVNAHMIQMARKLLAGRKVLCDRYSTHERIEVQVRSIKAIPSLMFGSSLNSREVVGNIYETGGEGDGKN